DLTAAVLAGGGPDAEPAALVRGWLDAHPGVAARVEMIRLVSDGKADVARMNVGLSQVRAMLAG
ncbi:MAG: hypothetical protein WAL91_11065, partial [Propionicimonas sp.]